MIGIYAHHAGSGHLHRARAIRAELTEDAQILSSAPGADIVLPLDHSAGPSTDATAGDTLHWAPVHETGLTERMAMISDWIRTHRPSVFYVDVSVEVALLARLHGVPVATLAMPGVRDDAPHQLAYAQAAAIIAAWPDWVPAPAHLAAHRDRLHRVGGITRLRPEPGVERGEELVMLRGAGGDDWDARDWPEATVLGGDNRVDDPMPYLQRARAVIAAAGQNSVADLAAAGAPAIVLPQDRPFGEQHATARLLDEAGIAVTPAHPPRPEQWEDFIAEAVDRAAGWPRWQTDGAAARAARVIEEAGR